MKKNNNESIRFKSKFITAVRLAVSINPSASDIAKNTLEKITSKNKKPEKD